MNEWNRVLLSLPLIAGVFALLVACEQSPTAPGERALAAAGHSKVEVCHVDGDGQIRRIEVATPAVEAHLAHGDHLADVLPPGSTFSASASLPGHGPEAAFDGDPWFGWNAGWWPPQWIEVDFGSPQKFSEIRAKVDQFPDGITNHDVTLDDAPAFSWTGFTSFGQVLSHTFGSLQTARKIRVTTTAGPSWVAWFEIEIRGC